MPNKFTYRWRKQTAIPSATGQPFQRADTERLRVPSEADVRAFLAALETMRRETETLLLGITADDPAIQRTATLALLVSGSQLEDASAALVAACVTPEALANYHRKVVKQHV